MDIPGSKATARHRPSLSTERLLGAYPHAPPESAAPSTSAAAAAAAGGELHEDDLFWSGGDSPAESPSGRNIPSSPSSSYSSSSASASAVVSRLTNHSRIRSFAQPEGFGILAALPEDEASSPSLRPDHSGFFHKASVSSSSSSSSPSSASRLIPIIPKPPQERIKPISSVKYHQSAPVNVPLLSEAMRTPRDFFGEEDGDGGGGDGEAEMLPPHEMVARSLMQSPRLSCSVLEGAGRTLKGRDLRQVRNAIWRQTGFLD